MTLHDFTPPPTDPEQAPTKAPIKSKNEIENGHSDDSPIEKPVVETIETVWKDNSLKDGDEESFVNRLISIAIKNINNMKVRKNLNSGSKIYFNGLFL